MPEARNFIKKETPTQVFSCEFCKLFWSTSGALLEEIQVIQDVQWWQPVTVTGVQDDNVTKVTGVSCKLIFFPILVFFQGYLQFTGQQGKGEAISLAPLYHFHPLYRYLEIIRTITAMSSPLHIPSRQARTGNLWFPSANH